MIAPRVLVCHNHYTRQGGESRVFEHLVNGLREHGHTVVTLERHNDDIDKMSATERLGLVASAHYSRRTVREVTALVEAERPDVAIVQNVFPLLSPSVYTTLHQLKVPIVQASYNYRLVSPAAELYSRGEVCERSLHGNYLHCVLRKCYRDSATATAWYASITGWHRLAGTFARTVDVFQVPDRFMARKLAEAGLPPEKMVVNINPFFVRDYTASADHDGSIVYAGRLVRAKGVLTFLEAIRLSSRARAVVVGEGALEPEIRSWIEQHQIHDRVVLTGPLWGEALARVMARAAAVAVPSEWYDNLPLVLCQANAMGKPVLASRINGIPEYVDEGVNGLLFTPGNAAELSTLCDAILSRSATAYAQLSASAREFSERRLDFRSYYATLSDVFVRVGARP